LNSNIDLGVDTLNWFSTKKASREQAQFHVEGLWVFHCAVISDVHAKEGGGGVGLYQVSELELVARKWSIVNTTWYKEIMY